MKGFAVVNIAKSRDSSPKDCYDLLVVIAIILLNQDELAALAAPPPELLESGSQSKNL